jgi:hypothetical protein
MQHARADLSNSDQREWVAQFPNRTAFRGYQVRPTCTARLAPGYILTQLAKYQSLGYPRGFVNTVLGEAFASAEAQLQRSDIEKCMRGGAIQQIDEDTPVYLGVDIGFQCHITLSVDTPEGLPHFILFQTVPVAHLEGRISELREIYNIVQGASDRFPLTTTVDALRDITNGLIMPIQYRGTAALAPVKDELGKIVHYSANRTLILDRMHMLITNHKLVMSGYTSLKETIIAHLTDMVRDEQPDIEAEWKKITGNDHFFHSMALNLLARRVCEHMFHVDKSDRCYLLDDHWSRSGNYWPEASSTCSAAPGRSLCGAKSSRNPAAEGQRAEGRAVVPARVQPSHAQHLSSAVPRPPHRHLHVASGERQPHAA